MNTSHRFCSLVLATVALLGGRSTVHAQSVAPVPAPTIITSAPYTITKAGYYQLGANLTYTGNGATDDAIITINASNVTLDFAGHYIAGPTDDTATTLYGIYASERANLLIQNGTVSSCFIGVYLTGNGYPTTNFRNPRLLNMTLTKCYSIGAEFDAAVTSEISDCRVFSIGGSPASNIYVGLSFPDCFGAKAMNNSIANVGTTSGYDGYGIAACSFAVGNLITDCQTGLVNVQKYKDNLTYRCTTPFSGGTAVGDNN